jgi:hypothetical protein
MLKYQRTYIGIRESQTNLLKDKTPPVRKLEYIYLFIYLFRAVIAQSV